MHYLIINKKLSYSRDSARCGWCEMAIQGHWRSSVVMLIHVALWLSIRTQW